MSEQEPIKSLHEMVRQHGGWWTSTEARNIVLKYEEGIICPVCWAALQTQQELDETLCGDCQALKAKMDQEYEPEP